MHLARFSCLQVADAPNVSADTEAVGAGGRVSHLMSLRTLLLSVVCGTVAWVNTAIAGELYVRIDDDGTVVVSDEASSGAVRYRPGVFEALALRQRGVPHSGLALEGESNDGFGRDELAPRTAPAPRQKVARRPRALAVPDDVCALVDAAAQKHKLPRSLLLAVIAVESRFNATAESRAGARGLMQLMPNTAKDLGVSDAFDPAQNVAAGAKYLAFLRRHFGDDALALAAYNAGPGRVMRAGNVIPDIEETRLYVDAVLNLQHSYRHSDKHNNHSHG